MLKRFIFLLLICSCFAFGSTLEEIKQSKVIKIGVRLNLPPFSNQNEHGEFEGFEISLAKAIGASILGKNGEIQLVGLNAKDRIPYLQNGTVDLILANFSKTEERAKSVDFATPYLSNTQGILTKKSENIRSILQLAGKKILFIKGTTTDDYLKANAAKLGITPVECQSVNKCFQSLQKGEADGYMHTSILIAFLQLLDDNIEMGIQNIGSIEFICPGVKKGNEALLEAVNASIYNLSKSNFFKDAYNNTFEPFYKGTVERKYLLLDDLYRLMFN